MHVKADLHLHSSEDTQDLLSLTPAQIIAKAAALGFRVLAFSHHEHYDCSEETKKLAASHGILLIPGGEKKIEGCDVLVYNVPAERFAALKKLEDLRQLKRDFPTSLIIAPHPFAPILSLGKRLREYIDVFDALEWTHFYTAWFNWNKKTTQIAQEFQKPLIACSDTHFACQFGQTYSELEVAELTQAAVLNAIKAGKITLHTQPLSLWQLVKILANMIWLNFSRLFR